MLLKVHLVKAIVFLVVIYGCELDHKESWAPKNWCFWTVVLEKTLESLLDCKEIQPVHPKGNQSWIFIGKTDLEAETSIFQPPDVKNWLIGNDSVAGKDWYQEEKGMREDELIWWDEFEQALGVGDRQGIRCAAVHGVTESGTQLSDWTELTLVTLTQFRREKKKKKTMATFSMGRQIQYGPGRLIGCENGNKQKDWRWF